MVTAKKETRNKNKYIVFILLLFLLLSIVMIYFSHIYEGKLIAGDDYQFHKMRIEGLYESIKNRMYFPRLNMMFMNSMGYASSIFYSDIFLYFPAILRIFGFSLSESYISLLILFNFLTFIVAYFSMYEVEKRVDRSLIFSMLYTLSTYRLFDVIKRAALGEVLAFTFLPLAFMGLYQILYKNHKKWYFLTLGMALIILSHLLSAILFAILIFVFLILNWKELYSNLFRKNSFIKAVATTIPLVSFYFLPILEQLISQKLKVSTNPVEYMSERAMNFQDIVTQSLSNVSDNANIGIVLLFFFIFYMVKIKDVKLKDTRHILITALLFTFLTTNLFPWKLFEKTFLNTIQFPWRFFTLVTLCLCWGIAQDKLNIFKNKMIIIFLLSFVTLLSVSYSLNVTQALGKMAYGHLNELTTYRIGGGEEYLPEAANLDKLMEYDLKLNYDDKELMIKNYHKNRDEIIFNFKSSNKQTVTLPLIYYKGYVSELIGSGDISDPYLNEDGLLSINVKGKGKVKVYYKGTTLQFMSLYFSMGSWFIFIAWLLWNRERNKS